MTVEYPSAGTPVGVEVYGSEDEVAKGLAARLQRAAEEAVQARGFFSLAISGGSLVATLAKAVAELAGQADFSKWQVLFVDERNVPHDSPDSNFGAARQALGAHLPPLAFWAIAEGLPVEQAAAEYAGQLLALATARPPLLALTGPRFPAGPSDPAPPSPSPPSSAPEDRKLPMIDLVLLGVGPDGHVASLFPNSRQLSDASGAWVLPVSDSPKPPPQRITLSLPALNAAHEVAVVATGGGKAEVVQRALEVQACPGALPVQLVHPAAGALAWLLDAAAASQLHTQDWTPTGKGKAGWKFPRSEAPPAE
eukprot:scaffold3.g6687.t1